MDITIPLSGEMHPHVLAEPIVYRSADHFEELRPAFSLVYEKYSQLGYTNEQDIQAQIRFGWHQLFSTSRTFVAKVADRVLGTCGIVFDSDLGLPSDSVFHGVLQSFRDEGRRIAEPTMLSCSHHPHLKANELGENLYARVFWLAHHKKIDDIFQVVNPRHVDYWNKKMGYEILGETKKYNFVQGAPGVLLHLDVKAQREGSLSPNPELQRKLFDKAVPQSDYDLSYRVPLNVVVKLLRLRPDLLRSATSDQRRMLFMVYPQLGLFLKTIQDSASKNLTERKIAEDLLVAQGLDGMQSGGLASRP